jgi:hypothetical protein
VGSDRIAQYACRPLGDCRGYRPRGIGDPALLSCIGFVLLSRSVTSQSDRPPCPDCAAVPVGWRPGRAPHGALHRQAPRVAVSTCDGAENSAGGSRRPPRGRPGAETGALCRSDGVQHLSAVHQRVLGLERVGEPVELLEPRIGVVLAVLGVTGNLDGDGVLGYVFTLVGPERNTGDPGADESASRLVLAPARGSSRSANSRSYSAACSARMWMTMTSSSLMTTAPLVALRRSWRPVPPGVNPCRTARCHQPVHEIRRSARPPVRCRPRRWPS